MLCEMPIPGGKKKAFYICYYYIVIMKIRLNRKYLDDSLVGIFELQVEPTRVAFVPKDEGDTAIGERGLPEYILAYKEKIPTQIDEPELFGIPHQEEVKQKIIHNLDYSDPYEQPTELWLKYQKATVILITEKKDDEFREKNKNLIERIEALYVE
jgi:hypothetical protein